MTDSAKRKLPKQIYQQGQKQRITKKIKLIGALNSDFPLPSLQQKKTRSLLWGPFLKLTVSGSRPSTRFGDIYVSKCILTEDPPIIGRKFMIVRFLHQGETYHQLFYRSSGANSRTPKVWFPCDGLVLDYDQGLVYAKLNRTKFSKNLLQDASLLKSFINIGVVGLSSAEEVRTGALVRFGTPLFVYVSYLLGGDVFWGRPEARRLMGALIGADLDIPTPEYDLEQHTERVITSNEDVNRFTRDAVSPNCFWEEYERKRPIEKINLERIYDHEVAVGGGLSKINRCEMRLYIEHKKEKLIPVEILYYWDLPNLSCLYIKNFFLHLVSMIRRGRIPLTTIETP